MANMGYVAIGVEPGENTEKLNVMNACLLSLFIIAVYGGGCVMRYLKGPALVAEILIGLLFASMEWFPQDPAGFKEAFMALGNVGLLLMIFDGGVHMDIGMLRKIGARAAALAVSGCFAPVIMVWLVYQYGFGYEFIPAITAGTALSSTAIGFTVQVLSDNGILQDHLGQLIMAGAMLDDVISIILLAMLHGLQGGELGPMTILTPLLVSAAVMVVGYLLRAFLVCVDGKTGLTDRLTPEEVVQGLSGLLSMSRLLSCLAPSWLVCLPPLGPTSKKLGTSFASPYFHGRADASSHAQWVCHA
jgi:Kef-type K+ transport system membrane component KefB